MNSIANRLLKAYRPMYLRGLLMDGQYRSPAAGRSDGHPDFDPPSRPDRRMLLAALTLSYPIFHRRSKP